MPVLGDCKVRERLSEVNEQCNDMEIFNLKKVRYKLNSILLKYQTGLQLRKLR
jgi:hypothetical protein